MEDRRVVVYVMCGVPGAGKSSYIEKVIDKNADITVSRDKVRFSIVKPNEKYFAKEKEVFRLFTNEINRAIAKGFNVYVDATHLTQASRKKLLNKLPSKEICKYVAICVHAPLSECVKRNEGRKGTRAFVPPAEISKMYDKLKAPQFYEGFEEVRFVDTVSGSTEIFRNNGEREIINGENLGNI